MPSGRANHYTYTTAPLSVLALRFYRQNADVSADIEEMDTECSDTTDSKAESYTMMKLLTTIELRMPLFIAVMLQVMQQFSGINAVSTLSIMIHT